MERGSFRVYAVGHSFSIISFVSSCMMNLGPIGLLRDFIFAEGFAVIFCLLLLVYWLSYSKRNLSFLADYFWMCPFTIGVTRTVLPTYVADPVVLLVYQKFSVFVVEQGMAEMYPLLAHGPLLRWVGGFCFQCCSNQAAAGSCGQCGVTDGARSRDAASAVLGESPAEWLRMGLYCSGVRCLADARWKR
ncbi:hypothetical protein Nepgr_006720 [Nepenthes gracilis]|uniref:Uncharacterized protein n=1 Tax=Nepenthes gracilis TaxID=150966 RepID=A0AAD3S5Z0_NEPGR|nr:hypothetical protein Nepgr_006720 [Nepenthes gracilis]